MNLNFINFLPTKFVPNFIDKEKVSAERLIFDFDFILNQAENPVSFFLKPDEEEMNILVGFEQFIDTSDIPTTIPKNNFRILLTRMTNYLFLLNDKKKTFFEKTNPLVLVEDRKDLDFAIKIFNKIKTACLLLKASNFEVYSTIEIEWISKNAKEIILFGESGSETLIFEKVYKITPSRLPEFEKITIKEF